MFLNRETGELAFADGLRLRGGMTARELQALGGDRPFEAREADGVMLAPLCELEDGALCAVTLIPLAPGASRQRMALFTALRLRDPCPNTRHPVLAGCAFGAVCIYSDPYFGGAAARVEYRVRDI